MRGGQSYWIASAPSPGYPPLESDLAVDVAVVGGGIAGMTTAALLAETGVVVAVLEADEVGVGVTGHTTGKLTAGHGLAYANVERTHGEGAARLYAESQTAGCDAVRRLAEQHGIECDLEPRANYVYAVQDDEVERLEAEAAAERRAGLPASVVRAPDTPFPAVAALRLEGQAQFHARKYALGLARSLAARGVAVHERTRVLGLEPGPETSVSTEGGTVAAKHVVLATNAPITSKGRFFARVHPLRAYAVGAPADGEPVDGMWINVEPPIRSVRTAPSEDGGRLVIVVGEGHRVGRDDGTKRYDALADFLASCFGGAQPVYRWSTHDQYAVDGVPFIGRIGDSEAAIYVATGFGGWGLSSGGLSGLLICDAVLGRTSAWASLYDPDRSALRRSPARFAAANALVAKDLVAGKLRRWRGSLDDVPQGTGRVLELEGERVAAYRNDAGEVSVVSAICTHMGCVVAWNAAERSWDCPCHGSRFGVDGEVLHGPATRPLEPVAAPATSG